ncbi:MAG: hypothetical protein MPJ78_18760 [Hyphomicrobiaceae bacterium]|nr:hypothetical protein [Hyphomicrobiaceae bacterium]
MTTYAYTPATGEILRYEGTWAAPSTPDPILAGMAAPMVPGMAGNGVSAGGVSMIVGGSKVPVAETLSKYVASEQIKPGSGAEVDLCHEIMLLPALLESATYSSLHSMFSEVPLARSDSTYPLPDGSRQTGPLDREGVTGHRAAPELRVKFGAMAHITDVQGPVGSLYSTLARPDMARLHGMLEERDIRHELEAFEALKGIGDEVWMNEINEEREDRNLAAKLREVVHSTRSIYGSRITHVAMGSRMYRRYLRSAGVHGAPGSSQGVGPLPGLEYVTVVISGMVDAKAEGTIYAVDRHGGALYGQGPIVLDSYGDGPARITEYYQYMITDNHVDRAGMGPPGRRTALRINVPRQRD